jgi:hypothetical protein
MVRKIAICLAAATAIAWAGLDITTSESPASGPQVRAAR